MPQRQSETFHNPLSNLRVGRLERVLAKLMLGYTGWAARSGSYRWVDAEGRTVDGLETAARLSDLRAREQPVVLSYFIEDALGVASLAVVDEAFLALMRALTCVVDDTLAGRISAAIIQLLGGQFALLPLPSDPERVRGVYEVLRQRRSCVFPVDGGGPYRRVGTGVVGLAASLGAVIVPISVRLRPVVTFAPQSRVRVPMPRCRIVAGLGEPIPVERGVDRRGVAAALEAALGELSRATDAVVPE